MSVPVGQHPVFRDPDNPDIKIWRYMDFAKYVSLLDTRSLYFPRSDKLDDPYEGTFSPATWGDELKHVLEERAVGGDAGLTHPQFNEWVPTFREDAELHRQWTYVNSWHMNEVESAAMWELYAQRNQGIAIQSTYAKLVRCLPPKVPQRTFEAREQPGQKVVAKEASVFVGVVEYVDYEKDPISTLNMYYPFIHKRKSFEYERELRAVIWEAEVQKGSSVDHTTFASREGLTNPDDGRRVGVSVDELVEKVVVAPTAPNWFGELVENISSKYGLNNGRIDKSRLYKRRLI